MLHSFSKHIIKTMPIRKSIQQKQLFRQEVCNELQKAGWNVTIESSTGILKTHNIIAGEISSAKYLLTAHYDTPANMILPNFISITRSPIYWLYQIFIVAIFLFLAFFIPSVSLSPLLSSVLN